MIITINNNQYDVTEFMNEHPGGKNVFKNGADMTKEFNKVGHSKEAVKMLEKYLIKPNHELSKPDTQIENDTLKCKDKEPNEKKELNLDDISIYSFLKYKFKNSKLSKLFTHEDYLNIHKILGVIVLCNYLFCTFDCFYSGCKGEFTLRKKDCYFFLLLILHVILSLSSLQFHIPLEYNYTAITITQQYRLHSILFVFRSFLIILSLHFFRKSLLSHIFIIFITFLNMYGVDIVNKYTKPPDDKSRLLISSVPFWTNCHPSIQYIITNIYSYAQVYGTFIFLGLNSNIEMNFFFIFVIQFTAFMGTLSKKGIINNFQWHVIYLLQYLLVGIVFFYSKDLYNLNNVLFGLFIWFLRTKINMNKYVLWILVTVIIIFTKYIHNNSALVITLLLILCCFNYFNCIFDKKRDKSHNIINSNTMIQGTKLHLIEIKLKKTFEYNPGQYFNLYVDKEKRPYTPIHYDKVNNTIQFLIKDYGGDKISGKICNLTKDMCIHLDGPFGKKYYNKELDALHIHDNLITKQNILMFYCGTGVTPFYSIVQNLNKETKYTFKLFGSLNNKNEHCFPNIKQKIFYTNQKLTPKRVNKIITKYDPQNTIVLLCGTENYNLMITDTIKDTFETYKF